MPQIHRFENIFLKITQKTSYACFKICESVAIIKINNKSKFNFANNFLTK